MIEMTLTTARDEASEADKERSWGRSEDQASAVRPSSIRDFILLGGNAVTGTVGSRNTEALPR